MSTKVPRTLRQSDHSEEGAGSTALHLQVSLSGQRVHESGERERERGHGENQPRRMYRVDSIPADMTIYPCPTV